MFFKISTPQILAFFFTKLAILFQFFDIFVIILVFQCNRKSPLGFDNKLLENFFWPRISFQLLLLQIVAVFYATCNFVQVLNFLSFFRFLQPQEPHNLL